METVVCVTRQPKLRAHRLRRESGTGSNERRFLVFFFCGDQQFFSLARGCPVILEQMNVVVLPATIVITS